MKTVSVIIPNLNGREYLPGCLTSLRKQTFQDFEVFLIDNGSTDGSLCYVREHFPEVKIRVSGKNTGFCGAVNEGIRLSNAPYVLLLNNDTISTDTMVEELLRAIQSSPRRFACQAKMLSMQNPSRIDDAGDFYCALGWAFARGKGKEATRFQKEKQVFSCCAAAAIYRRDLLNQIGGFDRRHFAYLEDLDLGWRAQLYGYENWYSPSAVVYHAGSATTGSRYNAFKVRLSARNSVYVIAKNMPSWQILLNLPCLLLGYGIKGLFFVKKGFFREYAGGLLNGLRGSRGIHPIRSQADARAGREDGTDWKILLKIQAELLLGLLYRLFEFLPSG